MIRQQRRLGQKPTGQWWIPPIDGLGTESLAARSVRDCHWMQPFPPENLIQYHELLEIRLHGMARNALKLRPKRVKQMIEDYLGPTLLALLDQQDPDQYAIRCEWSNLPELS